MKNYYKTSITKKQNFLTYNGIVSSFYRVRCKGKQGAIINYERECKSE